MDFNCFKAEWKHSGNSDQSLSNFIYMDFFSRASIGSCQYVYYYENGNVTDQDVFFMNCHSWKESGKAAEGME